MRKWSTVKKKYDYITTIEPFVSCDGLMKYELRLCVFLYVCDCESLCVFLLTTTMHVMVL
jgi:hypothetical protein